MFSLRFRLRLAWQIFGFCLLPVLPLRGEDAGAMLDDPTVYFKIVKAIQDSRIEVLKPKVTENTSYHLKSVEYLGYVTRFGKRYYIAQAFFLRSSPQGRETPPPRGHSTLLILDSKCRIVSHGWDGETDLHLSGTVLESGGKPVLDFEDMDIRVRHSGWIWGGSHLPYPFEDRISDEDWESGAFREKDRQRAEQEKAKKH
ncbi:hypothetical protein KBB96_04495 [Luteolibacter ambystomatis]|uniref:Uncharacterized protein n=1 Tax=Luteolibacter ambystomatis TaxID=2824561 RepID=A0A975J175_9BACT|nr:hypothetical protein [Luteolibacter ambystomatis]QUE52153.1 hypothetical protein KBB96_04495 [Luteolibacter ambystomatis]